jgi:hypothetical protein
MSGVNNFPDGVAPGTPGFLPNPKAPEELVPPLTEEDLSWIADNETRAVGLQPKTATNPKGQVTGIPLSTHPPKH